MALNFHALHFAWKFEEIFFFHCSCKDLRNGYRFYALRTYLPLKYFFSFLAGYVLDQQLCCMFRRRFQYKKKKNVFVGYLCSELAAGKQGRMARL